MINKYFLAKMNIPAYLKKFLYDRYNRYIEIEGIPPIIFQGNGEYLLDYRIDGARGGVGERTKNLLQNTATTQVKNGVTFTINKDKSISCNGTASSNVFFKIGDIQLEENCIMSGCPAGGGNNTYVMRLYNNGSVFKTDSGDGVLINSEIQNGYVEIRIAAGYTCNNLTFYPMIRLASIEDDTYDPYGYKVPVVVNGKNLLQNNATSQTVNGVTFTVNNDKSITCNGTATGTTAITINTIFSINSTKISGCPMGGSWSSFQLDLLNINNNNVEVVDTGNGAVIQNENSYRVRIRIASGYTCNNLTFYPMIRKADIEDDTYEPYHEPTTTNIYLDEPIDGRANIPSEYEEVEYIESTGTQYIDTNIIPTNTTGVEAKISICTNNNKDNIIMGCRETADGENRYWIDVDWTGSKALIFGFNNNTSVNDRYPLKGSDVGKSFIISMNYMNDRTGKINGITYDTSISSKTLTHITKPIYIFAGNRSGNASYQYSGKLYNLKITDGTNVIKNFVPCYRKSDNVAGLYDLVNNTFYTNQGTGNFIVGPIKENESISLSDTNVNIPTIKGTNVLTVDTTVQPSNVYVKVGGD